MKILSHHSPSLTPKIVLNFRLRSSLAQPFFKKVGTSVPILISLLLLRSSEIMGHGSGDNPLAQTGFKGYEMPHEGLFAFILLSAWICVCSDR